MSEMKKTTVYLPEDLKRDLERAAKRKGTSEADMIRDAIESAVEELRPPDPRIPLVAKGLGAPDIAERAEELLDGFGQ